jgi:hypothetical protein
VCWHCAESALSAVFAKAKRVAAFKAAMSCRCNSKTHTLLTENCGGLIFACPIKIIGVATMSINSINSSVQNQYPQISTPTANKTADAEAAAVSAKSTSTIVASDTVTISAAGQAMASSATGFTTMLQPFDAGRALTADDKALIGYPNPSNPYVTSMAATISELREKGAIQGKITSEYYKLDDGTQASIFDVMPKDAQSQVDMAPLKNRMMAKFAEYRNGTADEVTKLANENFFLGLGRDAQSTSSPKAKAMMRDYTS